MHLRNTKFVRFLLASRTPRDSSRALCVLFRCAVYHAEAKVYILETTSEDDKLYQVTHRYNEFKDLDYFVSRSRSALLCASAAHVRCDLRRSRIAS
jgi:hypothetical protein